MKRLVVAAALVATCATAHAQPKVYGFGNASCGQWVADHNAKNTSAAAQEAWLGGYLSGLNALSAVKDTDYGGGVDWAGLVGWVSNYCTANPLDKLNVAALQLVAEIGKRQGAALLKR